VHIRGIESGEAFYQVCFFAQLFCRISALKVGCSTNVRKHEQLTKSLRKMEKTLDTVLRSIGNPGLSSMASDMVSRSGSPSSRGRTSTDTPPSPGKHQPLPGAFPPINRPPASPRLHSLPDNELNPLGLLADDYVG
jgi:hypothetical protein